MQGIWLRAIPRLPRVWGRNHRLLPRQKVLETILGTIQRLTPTLADKK
nr:MAG TPA: hypothetical protein [Caudoviricetes sp.]